MCTIEYHKKMSGLFLGGRGVVLERRGKEVNIKERKEEETREKERKGN